MTPALQITNLTVTLPLGADRPYALEDVSFTLEPGKILCVVGESGSGKSMTASAIMRLLPLGIGAAHGQVTFAGANLLALSEAEMRRIRGAQIAMIFQEPMTALNPLRRIGDQIGEMFTTHTNLSRQQTRSRAKTLLEEVHLPDPGRVLRAYPHELSGGQRQRAMIAMALALEPAILIADEPTTALDVTTQAQILALIRDLQTRRGMAVLFITHDFGVVADIADRIAVMQSGRLVEQGDAASILNHPRHPYTRTLIAAVPPLTRAVREALPPASSILTLERVSKTFGKPALFRRTRVTKAVADVSLSLPRGSTLGIVGESGSGKSTLARCIVRLLEPEAGSIRLDGADLLTMSRREMRAQTAHIQMVFQDPYGSLNPRRRAGDLVAQGPILHGLSKVEARARARHLFALVGLQPDSMDRFPHEFSGGQRQRIGLARALALRPKILVADEAVSALDVSVQAQILQLLADLRARLGLSMIFITHDLRVAAQICDRIAVMRDGAIVEQGETTAVLFSPQHPYTQTLLASVPGRNWTPPTLS